DDLEEFSQNSSIQKDFYTNSIGEATESFVEKGKKLINNIPKPFVKQFEKTKEFKEIQTNTTKNSLQQHKNLPTKEMYCRKMLLYAKKGDIEKLQETLDM
ncbi:MAG: hypothetical protein ACKO96_20515, partial [Flammeovirgaceae bacterium]